MQDHIWRKAMLSFANIYCGVYVNRGSITHGGEGGGLQNSVSHIMNSRVDAE